MRAATTSADGGPEVLRIEERPRPEPRSDEVLIEIAYAGLNRADLLERAGRYGRSATAAAEPAARAIPGIECSGIVAACGSNVTSPGVGSRVCGIVPAGAHAEYVAVPASTVALVPERVSLREAAAVPEAFLTSYDALFTRGGFGLRQTVLVHAVGSSAGLAAVNLARMAGGLAYGTSRTPAKLERAIAFGMRRGFAPNVALADDVLTETGGRGLDLVLDFVGGPELNRNIAMLRRGGRIVQIGTLAGTQTSLDLGLLMGKRATIVGTVLRTRGLDERIGLARVLDERLLPAFAAGELQVAIDREFALDDLAEAHRYMESDANFGKVLVCVKPG